MYLCILICIWVILALLFGPKFPMGLFPGGKKEKKFYVFMVIFMKYIC